MELDVCDTTMTPRLPGTFCFGYRIRGRVNSCGTYPQNLGPCTAFEAGMSGRCVYCDHSLLCHPSTEVLECLGMK